MKKFNKVITVEVEIDRIAEQLLATINPDFKHRENVVEAIIGGALHSEKISYIYNSLNGYNNDIDFEVKDTILVNHEAWNFISNFDTLLNDGTRNEPAIGEVIDIDLYRKDKLCIRMTYVTRVNGVYKLETSKEWVNHTNCNKTCDYTLLLNKMENAIKNTLSASE